jgi:hypothetical protein
MKTVDILKDIFESEAMHLLLDHIVLCRLKESRDISVEQKERLEKIADSRMLEPFEREDLVYFMQDIAAFNLLIKYYGG